ncbi:MAG TPA: energy transducer TonB [Burkholderiaceae bacterium]|nr:energy transducer TonB [Burkholderiaceae bacterium]
MSQFSHGTEKMTGTTPVALILVGLCMLAACSAIPVERLSAGTSMITTGGGTAGKWQEIPMSAVQLKDPVYVVSYVQWDPATESAGRHRLTCLWYAGDKIVATSKGDLELKTTPFRLWCRQQAAGLGVGHFRAQVMIDDRVMTTSEFNVVGVTGEGQGTDVSYYPGSAPTSKDSGTAPSERSTEKVVAHCPNALQAAKDVGYPSEAAAAGITSGSVTVSLVLTPEGAIKDIAVLKSSDRSFNQAAIDTVTRLKCEGNGLTRNTELRWEMEYHAR